MRWAFRVLSSSFVVVVVALLALTTETTADELGFVAMVRSVVRDGAQSVIDAGYTEWLVRLLWLLIGVSIVAWGEYGLRRWEAYKARERKAHIKFEFRDGMAFGEKIEGVEGAQWCSGALISSNRLSDPVISDHVTSLTLMFDHDIADPVVMVFSDDGVIWRTVEATKRFVSLEVDPKAERLSEIEIVIRPASWPKMGGLKQPTRIWSDAWQTGRANPTSTTAPQSPPSKRSRTKPGKRRG